MSRTFVCGDIHGAYDKLMAALERVGFDREKDKLYALGDLVDRGPKSYAVLKLLEEPWFESIKGNHELMVEANYLGEDRYEMHKMNGGGWFDNLDQTEKDHCYALVKDLPIAVTLETPSGRRVGLVHAEIPGNDWDEFEEMLASESFAQAEAAGATALWGRTKIKACQNRGPKPPAIRNIDVVYMGHTPTDKPFAHENMRWIDTGACFGGELTLVELT